MHWTTWTQYGLRLMAFALFVTGVQAADFEKPPSANHGFVLATLPGSEPIDALVLRSVADNTDYRLAKIPNREGKTFGLWLPAGEYKILKWRDSYLKEYPSLVVAPGQLTDMGSLVPVPVGDGQLVLLPLRNDETRSKAQATVAELEAALSSKDVLPWDVDRVPPAIADFVDADPANRFGLIGALLMYYEGRANASPISKQLRATAAVDAFLALAKTATPPLTQKLVADAKGRSYFGAALGQIRVRDAGGVWGALDTGSLHHVTAVAAWEDTLLAGFENGLVRMSTDGGLSWKPVATLDRGVAITDISRIGDQWLVTAARGVVVRNLFRSVDQLSIYVARAADLSDIAKQRELAVEVEPLLRPSAMAYKNFYFVNAYPKLWRLDTSTMQWSAVGPDTDVHGFQLTPGNGTLAAYRIKGGFSKLFVSTDLGQSWTKYDNPPYVIMDVRFTSAQDGQAARWNTGAFSGVIELLQYDRAKDAWSKFSEAPAGCKTMLPDVSYTAKLCVTRGGNILKFADGKWLAEFAVD